eukprot:scaffold1969_cov191-Amphora_coffeaeformis.AAC.5
MPDPGRLNRYSCTYLSTCLNLSVAQTLTASAGPYIPLSFTGYLAKPGKTTCEFWTSRCVALIWYTSTGVMCTTSHRKTATRSYERPNG